MVASSSPVAFKTWDRSMIRFMRAIGTDCRDGTRQGRRRYHMSNDLATVGIAGIVIPRRSVTFGRFHLRHTRVKPRCGIKYGTVLWRRHHHRMDAYSIGCGFRCNPCAVTSFVGLFFVGASAICNWWIRRGLIQCTRGAICSSYNSCASQLAGALAWQRSALCPDRPRPISEDRLCPSVVDAISCVLSILQTLYGRFCLFASPRTRKDKT